MLKPTQAYCLLLKSFGPQGWWPVTRNGITEHRGGPKSEGEKWEVVVGAILTQNTAWTNVEKALAEMRKQNIWSIESVATAPAKKLEKAIRSAGYFRQKAKYLKETAKYIQKNYGSKIEKMFSQPIGALRYELLSLKGIGPETADSIILYSANKPRFVVDAYTRRICGRLGWPHSTYKETQEFFESNLPEEVKLYQEYHALLVKLAKRHCLKREPLCENCPLEKNCSRPNDA